MTTTRNQKHRKMLKWCLTCGLGRQEMDYTGQTLWDEARELYAVNPEFRAAVDQENRARKEEWDRARAEAGL